jgi:hypothetical protein
MNNPQSSSTTCFERCKELFGALNKVYSEMLKIHAELGNDETFRLMEYTKR